MVDAKDIQPGAVVEHYPSQHRYRIAAVGKMRDAIAAEALARYDAQATGSAT